MEKILLKINFETENFQNKLNSRKKYKIYRQIIFKLKWISIKISNEMKIFNKYINKILLMLIIIILIPKTLVIINWMLKI